jgi:glutamine cyclotransferase
VFQLIELEFTGGRIYANQLNSDLIYEIDPETGNVEGIIDLTGLWPTNQRPPEGVLNGIAVDPESRRIFVTGKYCPNVFEVKFDPIK